MAIPVHTWGASPGVRRMCSVTHANAVTMNVAPRNTEDPPTALNSVSCALAARPASSMMIEIGTLTIKIENHGEPYLGCTLASFDGSRPSRPIAKTPRDSSCMVVHNAAALETNPVTGISNERH